MAEVARKPEMAAATTTFLGKAWTVLADALGHFNDDDGWAVASHVAPFALMAVSPFLIFVAALAGVIGDTGLADRVADLLFATWPKEGATPIAAEVHPVLAAPGRRFPRPSRSAHPRPAGRGDPGTRPARGAANLWRAGGDRYRASHCAD